MQCHKVMNGVFRLWLLLPIIVCIGCSKKEGHISIRDQGTREDITWEGVPACRVTVILSNHYADPLNRLDYAFSYIDASVPAKPRIIMDSSFEYVGPGQVIKRSGPLLVPCHQVEAWRVEEIASCTLGDGYDCSGDVKY